MGKVDVAKKIAKEISDAAESFVAQAPTEFFRKHYTYKNIGFTIVGTIRLLPWKDGTVNIEVIWDFELKNKCLIYTPSVYTTVFYGDLEQEIYTLISEVTREIDKLEERLSSVEEDVKVLKKLVKLKNGGR